MDEIVTQTLDESGYTKACSYCGVFRRQALNIGAERSHADLIATGHNADDNAETGFSLVCFVMKSADELFPRRYPPPHTARLRDRFTEFVRNHVEFERRFRTPE